MIKQPPTTLPCHVFPTLPQPRPVTLCCCCSPLACTCAEPFGSTSNPHSAMFSLPLPKPTPRSENNRVTPRQLPGVAAAAHLLRARAWKRVTSSSDFMSSSWSRSTPRNVNLLLEVTSNSKAAADRRHRWDKPPAASDQSCAAGFGCRLCLLCCCKNVLIYV